MPSRMKHLHNNKLKKITTLLLLGLDWIGLDWIGLDWFGLVWSWEIFIFVFTSSSISKRYKFDLQRIHPNSPDDTFVLVTSSTQYLEDLEPTVAIFTCHQSDSAKYRPPADLGGYQQRRILKPNVILRLYSREIDVPITTVPEK